MAEGSDLAEGSEKIYQRPEKYEEPKAWERVVSRLSNIISWVMVPLLMPVYSTILIFTLSPMSYVTTQAKVVFTLCVLAFCALIPMGLVVLLKKFGVVQDLGLNGRKERLVPYIITIASYIGTAIFFAYKGAPLWMTAFYMSGSVAALINLIVNFWWKISAHAASAAGTVALMLVICRTGMAHGPVGEWTAALIILSGLLGSARVWLGRHTVMQVLCGYAVGFLCVYIPSLFIL